MEKKGKFLTKMCRCMIAVNGKGRDFPASLKSHFSTRSGEC